VLANSIVASSCGAESGLFVKIKTLLLPFAAVFCLWTEGSLALAASVVVGDPQVYGHAENGFPFSTLPGYYGYENTRYQQVYAASSFPGPISIDELVFYASGNAGAPILGAYFEFFLSVTDRGVNEISYRPFDDNLGADTRLFAAFMGGSALGGSDFVVDGTRFFYDPGLGNLLLDIRVYGAPLGQVGPYFAAIGPANLSSGGLAPFSRWHNFGSGFDNLGLVTEFRTMVPESGTLALLALGFTGLGLLRRWMRH
jgi:hypothetical protein